jgi:hypothetical protein
MSSINLQSQSADYSPSEPSKTGRLDVTWSGGVGSIDYGKIATSGGGKRRNAHKKTRKHRKNKKHNKSRKARHTRKN